MAIFIDELYTYNSNNINLDFYSTASTLKIADAVVSNEITCLWANSEYLFIGTTSSGVYYINKANFLGADLSNYLTLYKQYPDITDNQIIYMHGNDDCIVLCTSSGIDFFKFEPNGYRSSCVVSNIKQCCVINDRNLYYTVSGTSWEIYNIDPITNWNQGTLVKSTDDLNLSQVNQILTLAVADDAINRILFLATDVGVVVVDLIIDSVLYISN